MLTPRARANHPIWWARQRVMYFVEEEKAVVGPI
jgi:hypothetical protein